MMSTTEGELDVDVSNEREEGELEDSDVEGGAYIPLARPETFNPPSLVNMQIQDEHSDEQSSLESSGSDSDDEPQRRAKRSKIRPHRPQQSNNTDKKDKYNIWCKALQEELLTEDMLTCDVSKKNRYGVESYDYTIKYRLDDDYASKKAFTSNTDNDYDKFSNKRRHEDRGNVKLRLGKRVNSDCHDKKHNPRLLADLTVNTEDPVDSIASEITTNLHESKKDIIVKIIEMMGASKAIELYKETQRIEADGGLLVMNGTRRRTSGGIYFFLLKHDDDVSHSVVNQILSEDRKETARKIKKSRAKTRQKVMEQLKQSLTDSELPSLLSRGEAAVQSEHGSNPPPSPATDARDCSSDTDANSHTDTHPHIDSHPHDDSRPHDRPHPDARPGSPHHNRTDPRQVQDYEDDDFLELMCNDDMDLF